MGCHFLLQGIVTNQGLQPGLLRLLHWKVDSLPVSHLGSPLLWLVRLKVDRGFHVDPLVLHQTRSGLHDVALMVLIVQEREGGQRGAGRGAEGGPRH